MTEEELKDLCLCGETTKVQFKETFTSQKEIAKEMIAFANTKGGVILFGVEDKSGKLVGLSYDEIQTISRELGNAANEQVRPTIYIETDVARVEGKHFLVCTVEEGKNKPYKNLNGEVRILSEYPDIQLDNDVDGKEFKVTIPRTTQKNSLMDSGTTQKGKTTIQKSDSTIQKDLDSSQEKVLRFFKENPKATIDETVEAIGELSLGGVKFIIGKLQQKGLLKRVGGRKHGVWQVLIDE